MKPVKPVSNERKLKYLRTAFLMLNCISCLVVLAGRENISVAASVLITMPLVTKVRFNLN